MAELDREPNTQMSLSNQELLLEVVSEELANRGHVTRVQIRGFDARVRRLDGGIRQLLETAYHIGYEDALSRVGGWFVFEHQSTFARRLRRSTEENFTRHKSKVLTRMQVALDQCEASLELGRRK